MKWVKYRRDVHDYVAWVLFYFLSSAIEVEKGFQLNIVALLQHLLIAQQLVPYDRVVF